MVELDTDVNMASPPRRGPKGRVLGLLLIGLGVMWFVAVTHVLSALREEVLSGLLILLGAGLILGARRGEGSGRRRASRWPIVAGVLLVFALIGHARSGAAVRADAVPAEAVPAAAVPPQPPSMPQDVADLQPEYRQAAGSLTLDLTAIRSADLNNRSVTIQLGSGLAEVRVPSGTRVAVDGSVGVGEIVACGTPLPSGSALHYDNGSGPHLELTVQVGDGQVLVEGCDPGPGGP